MYIRIFWMLMISVLGTLGLRAQEQLGLRLGNYSGVGGIGLNPAHNLTSKQRWDIQLGGAAFFFDNNYFFLKDTKVLDLVKYRSSAEVQAAFNVDNESNLAPNVFVIDYFDDKNTRYIGINGAVLGPSFMVKLESGHTFGMTTGLRLIAGAQRIPNVLSYYRYDAKNFFKPFEIQDFEANLISFMEIGFNYAGSLPTGEGTMGIGITAKYLMPLEGGFFENKVPLQYTKLPGDSLSATFTNLAYGYTRSSLDGSFSDLNINGYGFAVDIGMVWTVDRDQDNYAWKFGLSLLDFGVVNYTKNAVRHAAISDELVILPGGEYKDYSELDELETLVEQFSEDVLGSPAASLATDNFQILMPAAISFQADAALTDHFYANAVIVQRLSFPGASQERTSILALTPRFEHRWFDVGVPLTLINWKDLRVGGYARIAFLTLGTHDLQSFVFNSNLTGTSFYAAVRIPFFELGGLSGRGSSGKNGGKGKVKCYKF